MKLYRYAAIILLTLVAWTMGGGAVVAQNLNPSNLSSSPYNRYGYGRMGSLGNAVTRSMGDVGIAVRSSQFTTLANPASLTAIDTLTMIFSVGLDAQFGTYREGDASDHKWDAGFSYMSMHMPLWRNFAMSLSFTPYSMVGYSYGESFKNPIESPTVKHDTLSYSSAHAGVGGINNFMLGIGWRPFRTKKQELSIGANVGWLFGNIRHEGALVTSSQASDTYVLYQADVNGWLLQLGAQYTYRLNATRSLTLGATFAPELNTSINTQSLKYTTSSDTLLYDDKFRNDIKQPMRWGVGLTYNVARKLIVTAEYEFIGWKKVVGLNSAMVEQEDYFNDTHRFAAGFEYLPKVMTNRYFQACRYRAGFSTKTLYTKVNDSSLREYSANLGISLPVNKRSAIDLGLGWTGVRPDNGSIVKEDYITLNLGVTFNEMMFFRNKLR